MCAAIACGSPPTWSAFGMRSGSRSRALARHDHRQVAPARVGGKLLDEILDHGAVEAVADHHAVDVARAEIAARRLDRERADQAHALADRDGERRIVAPAARDQHGRVLDRIVVGSVGHVGGSASSSVRRSTVACSARTRSAARRRGTSLAGTAVGRNW